MRMRLKKTFLKDLEKLPPEVRRAVEQIVFHKLPAASSLRQIPGVVKIRGATGYFRIRIGSHRIGFALRESTVVVYRVLDRKEIYRRFP